MVMRRGGTFFFLAFGGLTLIAAIWLSVETFPNLGFSDADPLSAVISLLAFAVSLASLYQGARSLRWQETPAELADRFAGVVKQREQLARFNLLGRHSLPIDVAYALRSARSGRPGEATRFGRLSEIVEHFQLARSQIFAIVGNPGSGKTFLALELLLRLIECRAPGSPVPIRLTAAFWESAADAADVESLERVLVEHLQVTYKMSAASAWKLVRAEKILPVVDGLDEMDATQFGWRSRAGRAIRSIQQFQGVHATTTIVLTCRSHQFSRLMAAKLGPRDPTIVELTEVETEVAADFIRSRVADDSRWSPVLERLAAQAWHPLKVAVATPWRLTMAVVSYEERNPNDGSYPRDPAELTHYDDVEQIVSTMLAHFVPACVMTYGGRASRKGDTPPFRVAQVDRWLGTLAGYLESNRRSARSIGGRRLSGTDMVLHEMWPLAGRWKTFLGGPLAVVLVWSILAAPLAAQLEFDSLRHTMRSLTCIFMPLYLIHIMLTTVWSTPLKANLGQLGALAGWRRLGLGLLGGTSIGIFCGLSGGFMFGRTWGVFGGVLVAVVGVLFLSFADEAPVAMRRPGAAIRDDIVISAVLAAAIGGCFSLVPDPQVRVRLGLALSLSAFIVGATNGVRYALLLVTARRRSSLPWRLSSFVQWCYHCGLLRIAGNAYQFRHDELQRYFARRHLPPQDGPRRDVTSLGEAAVAAYQVIGQPDAAAEVLRALHQHSRDTLGPFSEAALSLQVRRIFAESTDDSLTDAIDGIDSLLQEQIDILGNRHPDVFASQGSLAALLARAGSYEGALDVLHELRRQQSLYHGDDHVQVLTTRALIAAWGGTESSAAIRETAREEANRLEALRSTSASARRSPELLVSLGRLHEIGGDPAAARSAYEHASRLVDRSGQDIWLQWRLTMLTPPMRGHDHWHIAASRREILLRGLTSHEQMLHMLEEQRPKSSTEIVGRLIESRVAAVKARRDAKQQPVHRQSRPTEHAQLDPELWQQISLIRRAKEDAIDENDFESAIRLRDREKELRAQARQSPPTA